MCSLIWYTHYLRTISEHRNQAFCSSCQVVSRNGAILPEESPGGSCTTGPGALKCLLLCGFSIENDSSVMRNKQLSTVSTSAWKIDAYVPCAEMFRVGRKRRSLS